MYSLTGQILKQLLLLVSVPSEKYLFIYLLI